MVYGNCKRKKGREGGREVDSRWIKSGKGILLSLSLSLSVCVCMCVVKFVCLLFSVLRCSCFFPSFFLILLLSSFSEALSHSLLGNGASSSLLIENAVRWDNLVVAFALIGRSPFLDDSTRFYP